MNYFYKVPERISFAGVLLFVYILLLPFSIAKAGSASIYRYISLITIAVFCLDYIAHQSRYCIFRRKIAPFTLYFTYTLISGLWSVNFSGAVNIIFGMALIFLVHLFATSRVFSEKEYKLIKVGWIIAAIIIIYLTIYNGVESGYERYTATLMGGTEDKNQIPGYYFFPLLICLNASSKNKKLYIPSFILMAGMLYSIMLAGSRGGLLSIVLTVLLYFIFFTEAGKNNRIIGRILNVLLIAVVFIIVMYFILPYISETSVERFSIEAMLDDGGSGRLTNWKYLLNIYWESILRIFVGFGPNGTCLYLDVGYAHNQIIQVLFDGGLIGLAIYCWFIISSFRHGLRHNKLAAFAFIGMTVLSMTITAYTAYKVYWNLIMMMDLLHNNEGIE